MLVSAFPYDDVPSRAANATYRQYLRQDCQAALDAAAATVEGIEVVTDAIADASPPRALHDVADAGPIRTIGVGYDASDESEAASPPHVR